MHKSGDTQATRDTPEMPTSTLNPEDELLTPKRTCSLPAAVQRGWVPDSAGKNPLTENPSLTRNSLAGKLVNRVRSRKGKLPEVVPDDPEGIEPLPLELMDDIISRLPMFQVMQLQSALGRHFKETIHRSAFRQNRPSSEGEFSPCLFFKTEEEGGLQWHGFDTSARQWTRLPSLNFEKQIMRSPDPDLFQNYLVAGDGGLLCISFRKATGHKKLLICNPLTQQVKVLPPLKFPRHPVLMHLKVDFDSGHYKIIVAGSAAKGKKRLSLKTEEYDSRKGEWECPDGSDLPYPPFGLNEYQNGAYYKDVERELLMCIGIINATRRGVLVYDITKKKWAQGPLAKQLHIPLVRSASNVSYLLSTQIVECGGSLFVFSDQQCGRDLYFLIHKLIPEDSGDFKWDEVLKRKRSSGYQGLLGFTCVPISEHELCIFNTVKPTMEIIDLNNPMEATPPRPAPAPTSKGNKFQSLNPIGFVFKPSFKAVTCPRGRCFQTRCGFKVSKYCSECERGDSDSFVRNGMPANVCPKVITPKRSSRSLGQRGQRTSRRKCNDHNSH